MNDWKLRGSYWLSLRVYDWPRLIHQAHIRPILEAPSLKNGSGQELHHLHDVMKQHVRALKAMKYDSLETFFSSLIELKLDRSSMFAWQSHSKDQREVPSYTNLLQFIDFLVELKLDRSSMFAWQSHRPSWRMLVNTSAPSSKSVRARVTKSESASFRSDNGPTWGQLEQDAGVAP